MKGLFRSVVLPTVALYAVCYIIAVLTGTTHKVVALADPVPTSIPTTLATTAPTTGPAFATSVPASPQATTRPVFTTVPMSVPMVQQAVVPGSIVPWAHIATITYHQPLSAASAAPWLTYDYANAITAPQDKAVGIHPIAYTNPLAPLWNAATNTGDVGYKSLLGSPDQGMTCSGTPVTYKTELPAIVMDIKSPTAFIALQNDLGSPSGTPDTLEIDHYGTDASEKLICGFAGYQDWSTTLARLFGSLVTPYREVYGNLDVPGHYQTAPAGMTIQSAVSSIAPLTGALIETCLVNNPVAGQPMTGAAWVEGENEIIAVLASFSATKNVQCDESNAWTTNWAANVTAQRLYLYASLMIAGDAWRTQLMEQLHDPSGFWVYPESGLFWLNPTATATTVASYQDSSGLYVRNFGACYFKTQPLGPCIAAVNPGSAAVPFSYAATYPWACSFSGGGVVDPDAWFGCNAPVPMSIAPGQAVIALTQAAAPMGTTVPSPIPSATP